LSVCVHSDFVPLVFTPFPARRSSDLLDARAEMAPGELPRSARGLACGRRLSRIATARTVNVQDLSSESSFPRRRWGAPRKGASLDRKSTRLNSSHVKMSYAVFCLKKK